MRSIFPAAQLPLVFLLACAVGCSQTSSSMSESEASRLMEEIWTTTSFVPVRLGEIKALTPFAQAQAKPSDGIVNNQGEKTYDLLQRIGVLRLNQDRDLSKQSFSWENFGTLSQQGIRRIFVAQLLPPYANLRCNAEQMKALKLPAGGEWACLSQGSGKVEQIIRNEPREIGVDKYQVVFGTHRWKWDPLWLKLGQKAPEERKFRALLKYDAFGQRWSLAAVDYADRDQDFTTDNVRKLVTAR